MLTWYSTVRNSLNTFSAKVYILLVYVYYYYTSMSTFWRSGYAGMHYLTYHRPNRIINVMVVNSMILSKQLFTYSKIVHVMIMTAYHAQLACRRDTFIVVYVLASIRVEK